jgi:hypothetical protein
MTDHASDIASNFRNGTQQPRTSSWAKRITVGLRTTTSLLLGHLAHNVTLQLHGHKHDLAVRGLGHLLQRLQLPDLHGGGRGKYVGSLTHESGRVNFSTCCNDFGLSNTFLLGSGRKRSGNFGTEDDILDKDTLNGYTPFVSDVSNNLGDFECDGLTLSDYALDCSSANNMSESRLSTLDESLTEIRNSKRSPVRVADLEVNHGINFNVDIVTGDDSLSSNRAYLDFDIDNAK